MSGDPLQERTRIELVTLQAWALLSAGEVANATALIGPIVEIARVRQMRLVLQDALRVQALGAMHAQDWQAGEHAIDEAISLCRAMPYPHAEAKALYVKGQLSLAQGAPEQARAALQEAQRICNRLGERMYGQYIDRDLAKLR